MRVVHVVKHYITENESWLRAILVTSAHPAVIVTSKVIPEHRAVPGVTVHAFDGQPTPQQQQRLAHRLAIEDCVVHAHFLDTAWYWLPLLQAAAPRTVVSAYGVDLTSVPTTDPAWVPRYRSVFESAGAVAVQGPAGSRRLVAWGAREERMVVIPLGVPAAQLRPRTERAAGPVRFLQAAHYREKKGHRDTVTAFDRAFGGSRRALLTLVGDRPMSRDGGAYDWVHEFVRSRGLGDVIELLPSVSHPTLLDLLDHHDVYVQPSIETPDGDVEGGPVAVLDAQSRGVPVLATRHENLPVLVRDGVSGILVDERDPAALAEGMKRLAALVEGGDTTMSEEAVRHASRFTATAGSRLDCLYLDLFHRGR